MHKNQVKYSSMLMPNQGKYNWHRYTQINKAKNTNNNLLIDTNYYDYI